MDNPSENLGLAVRVLLDGTPESFAHATEQAELKRNKELLRRELTKHPLYESYEYDLAQQYAGNKTFEQINKDALELLDNLP